jgi:transposase
MVHVHGPRVQVQAEPIRQASGLCELIAVPVDVGKSSAMALVADFTGQRLAKPFAFALDRNGLIDLVLKVEGALEGRPVRLVRVGVEAAGHYHRPLTRTGALPSSWEVVELNPAHVTAQRRVNGQRGIKTDQIDLTAIFDLIVAGRGYQTGQVSEAMVELSAWVAHRRRRIHVRTATKNQLLGQVDRAFPGAGSCVASSLLATKVGRLVIGEFSDPDRLRRLGPARFRTFAARRNVQVSCTVADRFVAAARVALPTDEAVVARQVIVDDLALLGLLDSQIVETETRLASLLPDTPFAVLTTVPGWGVNRAARYAAAVGDLASWPSHRQLYRAAGLTPSTYESAGKRHDGSISREGSVELRGALLDLGMGLWLNDPATFSHVTRLKARGKPAGIIACALAHRANRIAFAMVRDQAPYHPGRWS